MATQQAGTTVGGRYRLESVLGRGGMGTVWAGRDELLKRDVAIKEVLPPVGLDDSHRVQAGERTMREARAAAAIPSRAAVTVYDVVEQDGKPWIVMERLTGRTLDDLVREGGSLPAREVAQIGLGLLDALGAAHAAGILHRDVKPGNVMFRSPDEVADVVLTDFGIAHFDGDSTLTATGMLLGSPAFLAPERARGQTASPASDLWALGVTLYFAVEGLSPFQRTGPLPTLTAVISDDAPPYQHAGPLAPVLDGLLIRDPAARMDAQTARALLAEVVAGGTPAAAPWPPAPTRPAPRPVLAPGRPTSQLAVRDRSRGPLLVAAVAAVLLLAAIAVPVLLRNWSGTAPSGTAGHPGPSTSPSITDVSGNTKAGDVPKGYYKRVDSSGFTIAIPDTWSWSRSGGRVYIKDNNSSRYLQVAQTSKPKPDAYQDWLSQEPNVAKRLSGYHRIYLKPVTWRGWKAADWEFTWGNGIHVLNRNVITSADHAYALYWSVPDSSWAQDQATFQVMAASFVPKP